MSKLALIPRRATELRPREFLRWLFFSSLVYPHRRHKELRFDKKYGTDTGGRVYDVGAEAPEAMRRHFVHYQGTPPELVSRELRRQKLDCSRFTFIDLGCGKGLPLMVASRFPFQKLIGVDVDSRLVDICQKNLERFCADRPSRLRDIDVRCQSATDFEFPDGDLLLFLFNPFRGAIMEAVMRRLVASTPSVSRQVRIWYCNSLEKDTVLAVPGMQQVSLRSVRCPAIQEARVDILTSELFQTGKAPGEPSHNNLS